MDCSPPGSSIHGIFQARVLEWVAIAFSEDGHIKKKKKKSGENIKFYWITELGKVKSLN